MSSLVAVGAGARVVKHGNRGASTTAGAADVIEALGVNLTLGADRLAAAAEQVGITFLFAQHFHPAMRHVMAARKQLGVRTAFNFLGPSQTRPDPRLRPWAARRRSLHHRWRRHWRLAAPVAWCSAAGTAATRSPPLRRQICGRCETAQSLTTRLRRRISASHAAP